MNKGRYRLLYVVLGILWPGSTFAQYMTDTSSVYNDMWFSDTVVYVSGSTAGSVDVHRYRVALTLNTPSGTYLSSTPSFSGGWVMNTLSAAWTAADLGADFIGTSKHEYFCTVMGLTPVLLFTQLKKRPRNPQYQCTEGLTNVCDDASNGLAPLGARKAVKCKQWNYCCAADNSYYSGWCRVETCEKTASQNQDPVASQCINETTCKNYPFKMFCK